MRDGSKYTGEFKNGEMTGEGFKQWADGRMYKGQFQDGELHGKGTMFYNVESAAQKDKTYQGEFQFNSREGQGVLTKKNGDVFEGTFQGNHPNGKTKIYFANGNNYEGDVIRGVMTGKGFLECPNGHCFTGDFKDGNLHGDGKFFVKDGTYSTEGKYTDGVPEYTANKYLFELNSPIEQEEEDPKAKKDKKPPTPEEEVEGNPVKIVIDMINPDETKRFVGFTMKIVHQAESYEDPNPPEEAEADKKKREKEGKEREPVMINPDPIDMTGENGREFEIQLGRMEKIKTESAVQSADGETVPQATPAEGEEEVEVKKEWVQYPVDQANDVMVIKKCTEKGILNVEGLKFELIPEKFKAGTYEIVVTDVTKGIENHLEQMRMDLKVFDSEVEAAELAEQAAAAKAGGKKK